MMFALASTALLMGAGVAIDLSKIHHEKEQAQALADSVSLNAAIFVSNNNRKPQNDEGYMHGKKYNSSTDSLNGGDGSDMDFTVRYDMNVNHQVEVEVKTSAPTMFMHMLGRETVNISATSTAKFNSNMLEANSVSLIFDNSGSMWFDDSPGTCATGTKFCDVADFSRPANPIRRIDGLKSAANTFLSNLKEMNLAYQERYNTSARVVRTSMMAYNQANIGTLEKPFEWGVLPMSDINSMTPGGGTNSFPSMDKIATWMESEPAVHKAENGIDDPIRYVIWLTDGMNTSGTQTWTPAAGTNYWRTPEEQCTSTGCRTVYRYEEGRVIEDFDEEDLEDLIDDLIAEAEENDLNFGELVEIAKEIDLSVLDQGARVTAPPNFTGDWEEGRLTYSVDQDTLESCEALKQDGVEIFAIGFALKSGTYYTNEWGDLPGATEVRKVRNNVKDNSTRLLLKCASSPKHVMLPNNSEELAAVFDVIGNKVASNAVRIAN